MLQTHMVHRVRSLGGRGLALAVTAIVAILARTRFFGFTSVDYNFFLRPWYRFIQVFNGWPALRFEFANYSPPYLYLLTLIQTQAPALEPFVAIKLISVAFDVLLAAACFLLIRAARPGFGYAWAGFSAVLCCPTVFANSAVWGQADPIYTSFCILAVWRLAKRDTTGALVCYAIAFSFKLQAIFLLPLFVFLTVRRQLSWRTWMILPTVFALSGVPAMALGRPGLSPWSAYFTQVNIHEQLTNLAPNLFQLLPTEPRAPLTMVGIVLAGSFVALLGLAIVRFQVDVMDHSALIACLLFMGVPFLLPRMHDRYFYPADVLSIVVAATHPRLRWLPLLVVGASWLAYITYLYEFNAIPLWVGTGLLALALGGTARYAFNLWRTKPKTVEPAIARSISLAATLATVGATAAALIGASMIGAAVRSSIDERTFTATFTNGEARINAYLAGAVVCRDQLALRIVWDTPHGMQEERTVSTFVHVLDATGAKIAQADGYIDGILGLNLLQNGRVDERRIPLPAGSKPATVVFGAYFEQGVERFQATRLNGSPLPDDSASVPVTEKTCP